MTHLEQEKQYCCASVRNPHSRLHSLKRCERTGKVERDGKWYCGIHDPVRIAEKRDASDKAWRAKWDAQNKEARLKGAAKDLYAALEAITDHFAAVMDGPVMRAAGIEFLDGVEGIPTIKQARAALAKARGES